MRNIRQYRVPRVGIRYLCSSNEKYLEKLQAKMIKTKEFYENEGN